jgi:hypothetical protein
MSAPVCGDGRFHHVAAVVNSNNVTGAGSGTLYVDGAAVATYAAGFVPNTAAGAPTALGVGAAPQGDEAFVGNISDARIFNRDLSAAEVLALSRPQLPSFANAAISPNPLTAPATTSVFVYSCATGFVGPQVTLTRSAATGAWASSGGTVNCAVCSGTSFSGPGSTYCVPLPTLPTVANAVATPAMAAALVMSYSFTCAAGFGGAAANYSYSAVSQTWGFVGGSAPTCSPCTSAQFSTPTAAGDGSTSCVACSAVSPNLVGASAATNYSGPLPCACPSGYYSNGAATTLALTCTACPDGSRASGSPSTCTCGPNVSLLTRERACTAQFARARSRTRTL